MDLICASPPTEPCARTSCHTVSVPNWSMRRASGGDADGAAAEEDEEEEEVAIARRATRAKRRLRIAFANTFVVVW